MSLLAQHSSQEQRLRKQYSRMQELHPCPLVYLVQLAAGGECPSIVPWCQPPGQLLDHTFVMLSGGVHGKCMVIIDYEGCGIQMQVIPLVQDFWHGLPHRCSVQCPCWPADITSHQLLVTPLYYLLVSCAQPG
jgi:hypothetical protein